MEMMMIYMIWMSVLIFVIAPIAIITMVVIHYTSKKNKKEQSRRPEHVTEIRWQAERALIEHNSVKKKLKKPDVKSFQGTAALMIGVVFVVLAGLIFATTTWHTLSNFSKMIMILGFSGLFFGTSWITNKVFKIEKTSQAFYILGSVFLFLTVLAAGYFKLLGHGFTLEEQHRFKVLLAGSLVTELALIAGIHKFKDRVYTKACFWGMTVSIYFLLKAFNLGWGDSIKAMVCYSSLLVLANGLTKDRSEPMPSYLSVGFAAFAEVHFGIFSVLMALVVAVEWFVFLLQNLFDSGITASLLTTVTIGLMAVSIAVMVLKQQRQSLRIFYSIAMIMFFHYLGMCIPVNFIYQTLISALLMAIWFLASVKKGSRLLSRSGDCFSILAFVFDTIIVFSLALISRDSSSEFLAASVTVVLLATVVSYRGKQHPISRFLIPFLLYPLTITISRMLALADITFLTYNAVLFIFLLVVVSWDVIKKDGFCLAILLIGTMAQLSIWLMGDDFYLFTLLLSVYLFIKSLKTAGLKKECYEKGSCLYLLFGVFLITGDVTTTILFRMISVTVVFIIEYLMFHWFRKEAFKDSFWEVLGVILLIADMLAFYLDSSLASGYLLLCLIIFAAFYFIFYRSGSQWTHLLTAIMVLPMPLLAAYRYLPTENQLYGFTAGALLLSGVAARCLVPIITAQGADGQGRRFDWFHILVILVIAPMARLANDSWRCLYLLLMAMYVLQYAGIAKLRKGSLTIAAALTVAAFWTQPFIQYPEALYLEMQLIPAVLFIWHLTYVWKDEQDISILQFILYCVCLAALVVDAFRSGLVIDALIVEIVCLLIFVWANIKKNTVWLRISAIIIVVVVVYMTKAFWLSLSWWFYLLVAGLGLIIFAAVSEMKKK